MHTQKWQLGFLQFKFLNLANEEKIKLRKLVYNNQNEPPNFSLLLAKITKALSIKAQSKSEVTTF
jgi:hypothetical protein